MHCPTHASGLCIVAAIWKGALSFGLVNIPVQLHSAVRSAEKISFRQLHGDDLAPIKNERVCSKDGEPVAWGDIVKGYEYTKGKFVVIDDDDFAKAAAAVPSSKSLDVLDVVRADEIDPRFFETPYFLVPQEGGTKAYALFRDALDRNGMVGIGKLTMRGKQYLAGVKPVGRALVLELMRFEAELVGDSEFSFPVTADEKVRPQEMAMAEQLIGNLAEPFDPSKYVDDYQEALQSIIKAKAKGQKVSLPEPEDREGTNVVDLMARLEESLAKSKRGSATGKQAKTKGAVPKRAVKAATKRARKSA